MKPLTLSPQEVEQAKTGKVTLVRPVEPQPDEDGLSFHKFWEAWFDTSERSYLSPFGKVGDEFWVREEWTCYQTINSVVRSGGRSFSEVSDGLYAYRADGHDTIQDFKDHIRLMSGVDFEGVHIDDGWYDASKMPEKASRYALIHKGTTVEKRDGQWVFIGDMEVKK